MIAGARNVTPEYAVSGRVMQRRGDVKVISISLINL